MKPHLVFNSRLANWMRANAVMLYPWILFAEERRYVMASTIKHEFVHVHQLRRMGWFTFYWRYWWLYRWFGWWEHPYEREARAHQYRALTKEEKEWYSIERGR